MGLGLWRSCSEYAMNGAGTGSWSSDKDLSRTLNDVVDIWYG